MKIAHINHGISVKVTGNKIVSIFKRETVKLKVIYHHLQQHNPMQTPQFTGLIA